MKQFKFFTAKILGLFLLLLCLLDLFFTHVYLHDNKHNKTNFVYNSKQKEYDIIFLGSSRANNHFIPSVFEEKGYKTYNYGMSGSHLYETALLFELMMEREYKINTVIIQIDLNIGSDDPSPKYLAQFLPFIHDSKTVANYLKSQPDFNLWYYIPFYRYIEYGTAIGFRETWDTWTEKRNVLLQNGGYFPLKSIGKNMKNSLNGLKPIRNASYEKIKSICKKNNIRLIAVTTPICENTSNRAYFNQVTKVYPEIIRYDTVVNEDKYFSTCGHLNVEGATILSRKVLKDIIKKY